MPSRGTSQSYRVHLNLINEEEFWCIKLLKLKYSRGDQVIESFCRNGFPQQLGPYLQFVEILNVYEKYSLIIQSELKSNEWPKIWVHKNFKTEIQKVDQLIQTFYGIVSPQ